MDVKINDLPKNQKELIIEISPAELTPYLEKAAQNISLATKIPGFREGKAPLEIVKKHAGEMTVYQEASHLAIRGTLFGFLKDKNIKFIGEPQIAVEKLAPGNAFVYKATVSLLPEVKIGDWQKIKVKSHEIKVEDQEVDKILESYRDRLAKESAKDTPVQKTDRVEIDFEVSLDKVVIEGGQEKNYPLVIGSDQMIPGFEDQIIGLKKGEEKNFQLKFPDKYHNKQLAGKTADFKIKVNNVFQRELPKLDDEFAKQLGPFKSLSEIKEKIKENLLHEQKHKEAQRSEQEMINEIVKLSEFGEIPELLIDNETEKMLAELRQGIESNGLEFENYLTSIQKTRDELKKEFTDKAQERVKASLVLKQLAENLKIEVTDEEVKKHLEHLSTAHNLPAEQKKQFATPEYQHYFKNLIANQKLIKQLHEQLIEKK